MKHLIECINITEEKSCWKDWVDVSDEYIISPGYYCDYCLSEDGIKSAVGDIDVNGFVYNVLDVVNSEYEKFRGYIFELANTKPVEWRRGQAVFNYIEELYGDVARQVQFMDGIDCFYDDENIEAFILSVYNRLKKSEPNKMGTLTSRVQSVWLMQRGIDTNTADLCWCYGNEIKGVPYSEYNGICALPCWSMCALFNLLPTYVEGFGRLSVNRNGQEITEIRYGDGTKICFSDTNPMNALVCAVEWAITIK